MKILESKIVGLLPPAEGNPRNSEGSFLRLDDGSIAFAYSRYTGNSANDHAVCEIACIYSRDGGETFDTAHPQKLVGAEEYGEKNVMSVTLRRMHNGDIGLFYLLKQEKERLESRYILRRYRGDFSCPVGETIIAPDRVPGYYVINNDRVEELSSGRWLVMGAYHFTGRQRDGSPFTDPRALAFTFYSDDDGYTWQQMDAVLALNQPVSRTGLQEPGCVELPGGAVYAYFRTDLSYQYESISADQGKSWFLPRVSRFSSPRSPMLIKRNEKDGLYWAVWNPVPEYFGREQPTDYWIGGRTPLVMAVSEDGVNFSEPVILENDPARGFCYPALHFLEDGILLAYCSGGREEKGCLNRITIRKIALDTAEFLN
ncbi:MAG: sialidase family protein [Clostridiales bacterium]|nr:sialidase family protein [Clostridiales bacterium]